MNRVYSIAPCSREQWAKQTCESGLFSCCPSYCQRTKTTESVDYSPRHRRSVWQSMSQTAAAGRGSSQAVLHQQYNDNDEIHLTAVDACRNTTEQSCDSGHWLTERGSTSHLTQFRSFRRRRFTGLMTQPAVTVAKWIKEQIRSKPSLHNKIKLNHTATSPLASLNVSGFSWRPWDVQQTS